MSYKSLLFFVLLIFSCILLTFVEGQNAGRFCAPVNPVNGKIKLRGRGRIAKYVCNPGYELVGKRLATCNRGQWSNPTPICVAPGCSLGRMKNGYYMSTHRDAFISFYCDPGYKLEGSSSLYCDGRSWNSTIPACVAALEKPSLTCDFEAPDLCGWNHDDQHEFEWTRHNFATPSGHVGTGPSYDHTLGEGSDGHYMYIEASSPRKENDTARLISPVYEASLSKGCFQFWYHMFGGTTGYLMVFVKPESKKLHEITPLFTKNGNQGNKWIKVVIRLPSLQENFQIVIQGIRGSSYVSDTAIDDVQLSNDDQCPEEQSETSKDDSITISAYPVTVAEETTTIKAYTTSEKPTSRVYITTEKPTSRAYATTKKPTSRAYATTEKPTSRPYITTIKPTFIIDTTTKKATTKPVATTAPPTIRITTPAPLTTQKQMLTTTMSTTTTKNAMTSQVPSTTNKPSYKTTFTPTISSETPVSTKLLPNTDAHIHTDQPTVSTTITVPSPRTIFPRKSTTLIPEQVRRAEKRSDDVTSNNGSPLVAVVLVVGGVFLVGVVVGSAYVLYRKRQYNMSILADDSDVRYLKDDEIHVENDSSDL